MSRAIRIDVRCSIIETERGYALEMIIDGMSHARAMEVGGRLQGVMREAAPRIFGEASGVVQ